MPTTSTRPPANAPCRASLAAAMALAILTAGCAALWGPAGVLPDPPSPPLPLETRLPPGLAVRYVDVFVRHVDQLPRGAAAAAKSRTGPPLPFLDHRFGRGEVFDSGRNRGVGMEITGYIRCHRAGDYRFQALSNDGVRVYLDGKTIIDDPGQHADQLSNEALVTIAAPGWYALGLRYFQRKGTAALGLYWKGPGDAAFHAVPPEALAHAPQSG
jgi:hypothetical protein